MEVLRAVDLGGSDLAPKAPKKPHWHIDHILNRCEATLVAVYAIVSPLRFEGALAKHLELDRHTAIGARGLGASDVDGNTHLLQVHGGEEWWRQLPAILHRFAKLQNMSRDRAEAILLSIAAGKSFTKAEKDSQGVYDTVSWGEVRSRLGRTWGLLRHVAATAHEWSFESQQRELRELLKNVKQAHKQFGRTLQDVVGPGTRQRAAVAEEVSMSTSPFKTFGRVSGALKVAAKFMQKSALDMPHIEQKTGRVGDAKIIPLLWQQWRSIGQAIKSVKVWSQPT